MESVFCNTIFRTEYTLININDFMDTKISKKTKQKTELRHKIHYMIQIGIKTQRVIHS